MTIQDRFAGNSAEVGRGAFFDGFTPHRRGAWRKRGLDLAVAIPLLLLFLPLLGVIALAVALDSRGPVLFRQQRLGLGGIAFTIYKFRTMTVLEDGANVVQASKDDARITRIGGFLRSTSLDELPQLLNVILGDMSLVGPRPHAIAHDMLYGALIPEYAGRQRAKPGITGWAQINGSRGATLTTEDMRERVAFDLWYVRHAGVALDLKILLRTPLEVLRQRNAY